jgi:hypothetical protein
MVSLNLQVVNTGNIGCMPLCKFKKNTFAYPNEKCPGNESKNYGMYAYLNLLPEMRVISGDENRIHSHFHFSFLQLLTCLQNKKRRNATKTRFSTTKF